MTRPSIVHPGCGGVSVDYLAVVASFPKPDDKIRSTSFQVQGGGNAGNALTCAARLGLNPRLISKIADDVHVQATCRSIPIVIDVERKREGLDELPSVSTYVVHPANFPQVWTEASLLPKALLSMLLRLPNVKFVIVTLGENGCILLERSMSSQSSILPVLHISSQIGFCSWTISLPIVSTSFFAENSYCRSSGTRKTERREDHGNSEAKDSS